MGVRADDCVVGFDGDVAFPTVVYGVNGSEQAEKVVVSDGVLPQIQQVPIWPRSHIGKRCVVSARFFWDSGELYLRFLWGLFRFFCYLFYRLLYRLFGRFGKFGKWD